MSADRALLDAMARQGVEAVDICVGSRLSHRRQVALLAAVFQDKDMHQNGLSTELAIPAMTLRRQVSQRWEESLERVQNHTMRHETVAQNQARAARDARSQSRERASSQQARTERLSARNDAELNARRARALRTEVAWQRGVEQGDVRLSERVAAHQAFVTGLDEHSDRQLQVRSSSVERQRVQSQEHREMWQARVDQGAQRLAERVAAREAFLGNQEVRLAKCSQQLQKEQDQARGRLRSRFTLVQTAGEAAQRDVEAKSLALHEGLERKLERSASHSQAMLQKAAEQHRVQEQKREDREHQRDRIARVKEYQLSVKDAARAEDSAIFEDCRRLQERMKRDVHSASDQGLPTAPRDNFTLC